MRFYYYPSPMRRVRVARRARSRGGMLLFFLALGLSFFLVRADPHEVKTSVRSGVERARWAVQILLGRADKFENVALKAPPSQDLESLSSAPFFGRDERSFIPYGNGFDSLQGKVGEATTLRAVSFEKRALQSCVKRCEIPFRDHFGRTVTGVFFKGSHYERLQESRGKVTITGLVQRAPDQSYVMYIQRVL